MKHFKSVLAMVLALVLVLSCIGSAFAAPKTEVQDFSKTVKSEKAVDSRGFKSQEFKKLNAYQYADDEIVRAIVLLEGEAEAKIAEAGSEKAANQRNKLLMQHKNVMKQMNGISYELKFEFTRLINGFSCDVAYGDLEAIAAIEGVEAVHIANSYAEPVLQSDPETKMEHANQMTGNNYMINDYYDGYGIVVAVLDTGLNVNHEAFADPMGYAAEYGVLTEEIVAAADTWVEGAYVSAKVPFAYDYADGDNDVSDGNGHGTHVSGTAVGLAATATEDGGYEVNFCGAAPAAQLLSMKIFKDEGGGTTSDIYFYALEDAYELGVDVVNMSIGAQNGFTYDAELETEVFGNLYKTLEEAGVILSVAAGNEYSMAYNAVCYQGYAGYVGSEYADYGTVASPSTYEGNVSVASVENFAYPAFVFDVNGTYVSYTDSAENAEDKWMDNFAGQTLEYVLVTDAEGNFSFGYEEDYANVDVTGKIAIVSRGYSTFEEKVEIAANAGAIGCIVVNNQAGIISMAIETFEIPAITILQSDLEALLAAETKTMTICEEMQNIENPNGYLMSDFSNWGTSPMLTIDPTITSVGGNVYSSVPTGDDTYEVYSGTSMAAPNATGSYANLLSAIYDNNEEITKAEAAELAKDLMASTAQILYDADEYIYSVRKQGAGLANSYQSYLTYVESAYITNPIQELGDDPEKTGVYEFSVEIKNDGAYNLYYTDFSAVVMIDYIFDDGEGALVNTLTSDYLSDCVIDYSVDGESITEFELYPGESITIDVSIALSDEAKAYLDATYPNGTFVEGFVEFVEYYDGEPWSSIHATYLAYYGNWNDGDVLEQTDFRDIIPVEQFLNTTIADTETNETYADLGYNYANSGLLDFYTNPNIAYLVDAEITTAYAYAGDNMLGYIDYNEDHIAFSTPLTDGTYNYAEAIYMEPYQLRNCRHLIMTVSDKETGEIYYVDDTEYLPKAYFSTDYAAWMAAGVFTWDGTDADGNYVPSGTVATITYDAVLPYGEKEYTDIWGFDVTVDYTAPTLDSIVYDEEAKTLTVTATDENYLSAIYLADSSYNIVDGMTYSSETKGESFTATFDVSELVEEFDSVIVTAMDYATNENEQEQFFFATGGDATVTLVELDGSTTYNCKVGDTFTFPAADSSETEEFVFWTTEATAATEDVYSVGGDWFFEDDMITVTEDLVFYALYAFGEYEDLEVPNYWYNQVSDYTGDWAICGWDYSFEAESYDVLNPAAINGNGEKIYVADLEDAVMGETYIEFYTANTDIRFNFANLGDNDYTIQNVATGKYLALVDNAITMLDEVDERAYWNVSTNEAGNGSLVYSFLNPGMILLYDDENGEFAIMDDSKPMDWALAYGYEIYPHEYYVLPLYQCDQRAMNIAYYATAEALSSECYYDDFTDCVDAWYHEAVDFAVANGLMNGVGNNMFEPGESMTRAMVVTVLYREVGSPAVAEPSTFTDVPTGEWYSDAIAWAEDNSVVNGVGEGKFEPETNVTREQIATILWRYSGSEAAEADLSAFVDADSISDYAKEAMAWAVANGLFQGDDSNRLNPTDDATRAEFACIIMRFLEGSYDCANIG